MKGESSMVGQGGQNGRHFLCLWGPPTLLSNRGAPSQELPHYFGRHLGISERIWNPILSLSIKSIVLMLLLSVWFKVCQRLEC